MLADKSTRTPPSVLTDKGALELPAEMKAQADSMFKEINSILEDMTVKLDGISETLTDLEKKLSGLLSTNIQPKPTNAPEQS